MPDRGILAPHLPTLDGHGLVQAVDFDANPHGLANRPEHEEPEASDRIVSRTNRDGKTESVLTGKATLDEPHKQVAKLRERIGK